jgi:dTMP kinase
MYDTFFGEMIGRYLSAKDGIAANTVDGKSMALWFALDRFEALRNLDYSDADVLLINRYVLSNAVYQSIRDIDLDKPDILDFCLELEHKHFGIPVPDLHLVLDMDTESAAENVDKKGFREYIGNARDVYESIDSIQARARKKYAEYAQRIPNVHLILCTENGKLLPIETIAKHIEAVVLPALGL